MNTIEALRRERGWTQKQLGAVLGMTGQAVYYWESGMKLPNALTLRALAETFGVCMDQIDVESPYRAYRAAPPATSGRDDDGGGG